jgi:4a-hydroxytetrahydrobiopterin dehydratase
MGVGYHDGMTGVATTPLADRACTACRPGTPALGDEAVAAYLAELGAPWTLGAHGHLSRSFSFPDFKTALDFVNRVGELADACDHHPDVHLAWGKVVLEIWTHSVGGLTENDFVLAARISRLS